MEAMGCGVTPGAMSMSRGVGLRMLDSLCGMGKDREGGSNGAREGAHDSQVARMDDV